MSLDDEYTAFAASTIRLKLPSERLEAFAITDGKT